MTIEEREREDLETLACIPISQVVDFAYARVKALIDAQRDAGREPEWLLLPKAACPGLVLTHMTTTTSDDLRAHERRIHGCASLTLDDPRNEEALAPLRGPRFREVLEVIASDAAKRAGVPHRGYEAPFRIHVEIVREP
jgi:hypothetical protein